MKQIGIASLNLFFLLSMTVFLEKEKQGLCEYSSSTCAVLTI